MCSKSTLGDEYIVALNLASSVLAWLRAIGANAMPKGLDLQGGVHFLMEIDQKAALDKMQERYVDDTRAALRKANIRGTVNSGAQGIVVTLRSDADRKAAGEIIAREVNQPEKLGAQSPLEIIDGTTSADSFPLVAKLRETALHEQSRNIMSSNLTTLRNRVNQLGVSEPVITSRAPTASSSNCPAFRTTAEAKKILGAAATWNTAPSTRA